MVPGMALMLRLHYFIPPSQQPSEAGTPMVPIQQRRKPKLTKVISLPPKRSRCYGNLLSAPLKKFNMKLSYSQHVHSSISHCSQKWENSKCLPTNEGISKMGYIYTMKYSLAVKRAAK